MTLAWLRDVVAATTRWELELIGPERSDVPNRSFEGRFHESGQGKPYGCSLTYAISREDARKEACKRVAR